MEKTVQVKTDSDNVKVAVITNQNKIVDGPSTEENLMIDSEIKRKNSQLLSKGKDRKCFRSIDPRPWQIL